MSAVSDAVTEFLRPAGSVAFLDHPVAGVITRHLRASGGRGNCLVECSISQLLFSRFQDLVEQRSVGTGFEVFQRAQESG